MAFDAPRARGLYASVSDGWIYLNAPTTQVPEKVFAGVAAAFRTSRSMIRPEPRTGSHARRFSIGHSGAEQIHAHARRAVADVLGIRADSVILGANRESLVYGLYRSIAPRLLTSEVVLTRDSLFSPFDNGISVRYAEPDLGTGEVPTWQFKKLITGGTRLVAVVAADPYLGVVNDLSGIAEITHDRARAWVLADLTSLAPYRSLSMDELGIDIAVLELAPMGGPEVAALAFRSESMFKRLQFPLQVPAPAPAVMGGISPLVDHYAAFTEDSGGTRRRRLERSLNDYSSYISQVYTHLVDSLIALGVHIVGVSGEAAGSAALALDRIPRVSFLVPGVPAATVHARLAENNLAISLTPASPLMDEMGVADAGGAVTVGLAPYNSEYDIDQLARVVASLR